MTGIFDPVHELMSKARRGDASFQSVLDTLLSESEDVIHEPFTQDLNHAWYIVGDACYQLANYPRAQNAFERSLADSPEDWQAHMALANVYFELNQPIKSKTCLQIAVELNPDNQDLLYNLGNAHFDLGDFRAAICCYEKIDETDAELKIMSEKNIALAMTRLKKE